MGSNNARPWHWFSLGMVIISPEISEEDAERFEMEKTSGSVDRSYL